MALLVGAGCSLTYGSEIEAPGVIFHNNPTVTYEKTFTAKIASFLGMNHEIVAAPGASNISIARAVISYMYTNRPTKILLCWTWPQRVNFAKIDDNGNKYGSHCISSGAYKEYIKHGSNKNEHLMKTWYEHMLGVDTTISSLEAFHIVNKAAQETGTTVININMGNFVQEIESLVQEIESPDSLIPNQDWDNAISIREHPYYTTFSETYVHFSEISLWSIIYDKMKQHPEFRSGENHISELGHAWLANFILEQDII